MTGIHTLEPEAPLLLNPYQDWDPWAGGFGAAQQGMNVAYDLDYQALRQLRAQGLSDEQAANVLQHRGARQSRSGISLWDPTRLQQRPAYPGQTPWSFETGYGLTAEEALQAQGFERRQVQKRNAELGARRTRDITALEAGPIGFGPGAMTGVTPRFTPQISGRPVGLEDGLGYDPLVLSGASANAAKINSTLSSPSSQPMQQGTGGATLDPLQVGMAAADLATSVLPSAGSGGVEELVQQKAQARGLGSIDDIIALEAGPGSFGPGAMTGVTPRVPSTPEPNVSGGGPGTSTAKGHGNVKQQMAKRGLLETADAALGSLDLGLGGMAQKGMQRAGAAARAGGMKNLGNALFRAGGAARVLAPAAAVGGAVLPAVFGAMDGYEQAGAGGALIQGGSGAAGALAGGAIGTAILPGVGTVIGAGIGSMLGSGAGSGLTGLAQGAVEKAQQGDTGLMGSIGRALDPLIDTPFEAEQKAVLQQMNSPAMKAIQEQERTRQAQARAQQSQQLLMQSYMQVI
ncbi:MAG: hypothetical protein LW834_09060 [Cyanobium sp. 49614_E6]|nr:hypothetical protein [Cyanobium sp. 49614_E6]